MPSHVPLNLRKPIQPRDPNTNTDETCGTCALCCKLLQIEPEPEKDFEGKSWNKWCQHCKPGNLPEVVRGTILGRRPAQGSSVCGLSHNTTPGTVRSQQR